MARIRLTPNTLNGVNRAIKNAERKTSGEIAVAVIRQSYDYAAQELLFSITVGFVYFFVMMFFSGPIETLIRSMFWDYSPRYLVMFYGFSTFLVIFLIYFIANIPFVDRMIVPRRVRIRKVNERAVRHFMESGVYNTRYRTGILLFISLLERRVELLADRGISKKIPQAEWNAIIGTIVDGIRNGPFESRLIEAVDRCGDLLAEHFPVQADDVNELSDDIEVLEQ